MPLETIADLKKSSLAITKEISSLNPSTLITLFEIDLSELALSKNITPQDVNSQQYKTIFRFHNHIKAFNGSHIVWSGNDNKAKTYVAAPIQAHGFEYNARGTLPSPKLGISVNEENILFLDTFKQRIQQYGDLVGAKVTRIRTFLKFLDAVNFGPGKENPTADWTKEFPRDIFYIDRKSGENKFAIEFELASVLDVEGLVLPQRLVISRCPFQYRGCGCAYEFQTRRTEIHESSSLLDKAIPIATATNELISSIIGEKTLLVDRGKYESDKFYDKGHYVYVEKDGVKYYYVSKTRDNNSTPPNSSFWVEDACSKSLFGCRLRWTLHSRDITQSNTPPKRGRIPVGVLPYGGFPSVSKYGFTLY